MMHAHIHTSQATNLIFFQQKDTTLIFPIATGLITQDTKNNNMDKKHSKKKENSDIDYPD